MQKNPDMLNIFLLGLARFHATAQDEKNSYYEICGKCYLLGPMYMSTAEQMVS